MLQYILCLWNDSSVAQKKSTACNAEFIYWKWHKYNDNLWANKKKYLLWELLWQVCYLDATIRFLAVGFPLLRNLHDCRRYLWILNGVVVLLWMKALVYRMDPPSPNDLWNTKKSEKKESIKNNGYNNQIALFRQK